MHAIDTSTFQVAEESKLRLEHRILVLRTMRGDSDAFEELFKQYHARLTFYARRLTKNEDQADDVMQDVWMAVYKEIGKLRDPDSFRNWVYRITRNRAIRYLGKESHDTVSLEDVPGELIEQSIQAEYSIFENTEFIHKTLNLLKPIHREILILRYLEGMDYEQIAEVVNCSVGTVRSRLHYAKEKIQSASKEMIA